MLVLDSRHDGFVSEDDEPRSRAQDAATSPTGAVDRAPCVAAIDGMLAWLDRESFQPVSSLVGGRGELIAGLGRYRGRPVAVFASDSGKTRGDGSDASDADTRELDERLRDLEHAGDQGWFDAIIDARTTRRHMVQAVKSWYGGDTEPWQR